MSRLEQAFDRIDAKLDRAAHSIEETIDNMREAAGQLRGAHLSPITSERREAAGKIGDENAPQEKGSEVDPRRMPDVQAP